MAQDLTSLFSKTASHIIAGVIKSGGIVGGVKVIGANGVLLKNNRLSNLVQDEIMGKTGVKGFISTDELPQYGINAEDKKKIMSACKATAKDVVVLVADQKDKTMAALDIIAAMLAGKVAAKPKKSAPKANKATAKPKKKAAKKAKKAKKPAAKKKTKKKTKKRK
jgi:Glu-tRNA(Gln) amidotransferase subunit E-like FAD-binding protein